MTDSSEDTDEYDDKIESHRYHIVKVLNPEATFDLLRQNRVLTEEDVERIRKKTTRRNRAGMLLDILRTKGNTGVNKFIECLEYENPECFEKITKSKPRPPPPDYSQNRQSMFIRLLNELPKVALDLRHDYMKNKDLTQRLDEMEQILLLAQRDKQELEEENEKLKIDLCSMKRKRDLLQIESENLQRTVDKLKTETDNYKRDRQLLATEKEHFREQLNAIKDMKDDIETENHRLREQMSQDRSEAEKKRSQLVQSRLLDKKDSDKVTQQILMEERDEAREQLEEVTFDLSQLRKELEEFQTAYYREKEHIKKLTMHHDELDKMLQEKQKRNDKYFQIIQQQQEEKETLEKEKLAEQKKYEDEARKTNKMFIEKHQIENELEDLKYRHNELEKELRNSQARLSSLSTASSSRSEPSSISDTEQRYPKKYKFDSETHTSNGKQRPVDLNTSEAKILNKIKQPSFGGIGILENVATEDRVRLRSKSEDSVDVDVLHTETHSTDDKQRSDDLNTIETKLLYETKGESHRNNYSSENVATKDTVQLRSKPEDSSDGREDFVRRTGYCCPHTASESSEHSSNIILSDLVKYDIHRENLPTRLERGREGTNCFTIIFKTPLIGEKINITGGNLSGIFIQDVLQTHGNLDRLCVGDEITAVLFRSTEERKHERCIVLTGMTLEEVKDMLSPGEEQEIQLYITHDHTRYDNMTKWMSQNESDGDYFYVRTQYNWNVSSKVPETIPFKTGDIFRVTSTSNTAHAGYWRVTKVTGARCRGLIPNQSRARKYQLTKSNSKDGEEKCTHTKHQDAVKCKLTYERVLPAKAVTKMPVMLYGNDDLVYAFITLINKECSNIVTEDTGNRHGNSHGFKKKSNKSNKHLLLKGCISVKPADLKYINICISLGQGCQETLRKVFGRDIDVTDNDLYLSKAKTKLEHHGIGYDMLTITSKQGTDKDSILKSLQDKISKSQNRYLWLSEKGLSHTLLEQYQIFMEGRMNNSSHTET